MVKNVNTEIEKLKKLLRKTNISYYVEVHKILSKIYKLRKKENKDFTLTDLYSEVRDVFNTWDQMFRIMQLEHCTPETWKLIKTNKITINAVMSCFLTTLNLRDPVVQNRFFRTAIKKSWTGRVMIKQLQIGNKIEKRKRRTYEPTQIPMEGLPPEEKVSNIAKNQCNLILMRVKTVLGNYLHVMKAQDRRLVLDQLVRIKAKYASEDFIKLSEESSNLVKEIYNVLKWKKEKIIYMALKYYKKKIDYGKGKEVFK